MPSLRLLLVFLSALVLVGAVDGDCGVGIPGIAGNDNVCCAAECGDGCGGVDCRNREGGADGCCTGNIMEANVSCDKMGAGPCIVQEISGSSSRTPVMKIPTSCELDAPELRWDAKAGVNGRIYAEGKGCFTMTDLYMSQQRERGDDDDDDGDETVGPIYVMDEEDNVVKHPTHFTGRWLLTSSLYVIGGGTFYCKGADSEGDCDVLRIESNGPDAYHEIRGHGGNLYFEDTMVTSWDTDKREVQTTHEGGRSFINCVSEKMIGKTTCAKDDMGECRMDIIDSEMGHLGFYDTESYGLTWKVRGFCSDKSNPEVFDEVDVFGDIKGSDIHHMYYGMYSYGHQGGVWTNNKMHDNIVYGFDPHDDSDYLTINDNEVYNNKLHGIIASKRCNNLEISRNIVYNGGSSGASGIFLHESGNNCKVHDNEIYDMPHTGIVLHDSFDGDVKGNYIHSTKYGIRLVVGAGNNDVHDNKIEDSEIGFFTDTGSDEPEYGDGRPFNNKFFDNEVLDTDVGVKLKHSDRISIESNEFIGTEKIEFNDAYATNWEDNTISSEACTKCGGSTFTDDSDLPP